MREDLKYALKLYMIKIYMRMGWKTLDPKIKEKSEIEKEIKWLQINNLQILKWSGAPNLSWILNPFQFHNEIDWHHLNESVFMRHDGVTLAL